MRKTILLLLFGLLAAPLMAQRHTVSGYVSDQTTGETHRRHHVSADGFYRGKKVIETPVEDEE